VINPKENWKEGAFSIHEREEKYIQNSGRKILRKETIRKI
jgi:hypothetical protein